MLNVKNRTMKQSMKKTLINIDLGNSVQKYTSTFRNITEEEDITRKKQRCCVKITHFA